MMASSNRLADHSMMALAVLCGGGSLVLFAAGPFPIVPLGLSDFAALLWDALLSVTFFLQHSIMVRAPVRARVGRIVPERYLGSVYAIASGVVLGLVLLLWQRSPTVLLALRGAPRWVVHGLAAAALVGLAWGALSLRSFDPFGLGPIEAHMRGSRRRASTFTARGAYRWVRHPLYSAFLLLIWARPELSADRLLFDALWTSWILVGTVLEEKDLVAQFGEPYLEYRRKVPMLIPWRAPWT
jgi:protein-S-isoprenylcysteine O-methyltransferase Ste14